MAFSRFQLHGFTENTSFKSCSLSPQPWLLDELSMDKRDSDGFFSTRLVDRDSDSSYNTTDLSLILVLILPLPLKMSWLQKLLGFLLYICTADLAQCWLEKGAVLQISKFSNSSSRYISVAIWGNQQCSQVELTLVCHWNFTASLIASIINLQLNIEVTSY